MTESTKPVGEPFGLQQEVVEPRPAGGEGAGMADPSSVANTPPQASTWTMVRELIETVVLSLIIFLLIRQVVQNYRIENHSMEPNFYEGQFVLVNKMAYRLGEPNRGDVVVFHNPRNTNEDYIKVLIDRFRTLIEKDDCHENYQVLTFLKQAQRAISDRNARKLQSRKRNEVNQQGNGVSVPAVQPEPGQ